MPNLSRRGFLQSLGAVGLTPLLPGVPARAAIASSGASASKALWASLYANSGSMTEFVGVARNMGLSNAAIQGVSARSIGVGVALAASTEMANAGARPMRSPLSSHGTESNARPNIKRALERYFPNDTDETNETTDQETENLVEEIIDEEPVEKTQ